MEPSVNAQTEPTSEPTSEKQTRCITTRVASIRFTGVIAGDEVCESSDEEVVEALSLCSPPDTCKNRSSFCIIHEGLAPARVISALGRVFTSIYVFCKQYQTCAHVPMPTQPSSSVPDGPLFTSFWCRFLPASVFGQHSPPKLCWCAVRPYLLTHTLRVNCRHTMPCYRLSTYGHRAFSVAGLTLWNSLPEDLRDLDCSTDSYRQLLKTFLFLQY